MQCPFCEHPDSKVTDSRPSAGGGIRRRRVCERCNQRFTTYERIDRQLPHVAKRSGAQEPFDHQKVVAAVKRVAKGRAALNATRIDELADEIEAELGKLRETKVSSQKIAELILERLKLLDPLAWERFAANYRREDGALVFDTSGKRDDRRQMPLFGGEPAAPKSRAKGG